MAASTTVMHLVDPGQRVVSVNDVYGGTYRLFSKVYEPKGYRFTYLSAEQCNTGARRPSRRRHGARVARDADEPAPERGRPARGRRRRPRGRRDRGGRQHVRLAVPAAADRARRRHRRPLDHEVPGRPLRPRGRVRGDERRRARRAPRLPAELARRRAGAVRRLARAAWTEDAWRAHARPLRERRPRRRVPAAATRASSGCSTRAFPTTPATRSPAARWTASAAWSRSSPGPRTRRWRSSRARRSGRWPRASAASRA